MAIKVNLLDEGRGMEFLQSGVIRGREVIEAHKRSHTHAVVSQLQYKIVDCLKIEENYVSAEEVAVIAELDREVASINPDIIIAFVLPNELILLLTELWEAQAGEQFKAVKHFFSRAEAEDWIASMVNS